MNTFLTADWHIGEDRFAIMSRPFKTNQEHIDTLIERHNSVVGDDDEVIVVGDAVYQKAPEFLPYVAKFKGRKTLIRGNHDRAFTDEQLSPYFNTIIEDGGGMQLEINGKSFWVTHYPTQGRVDMFNLVGHVHSCWKHQLNMLNVGVDVNHFYPVHTDQILSHLTAIEQFYDNDVWAAYSEINHSYFGRRGKQTTYFTR